MRSDTFYLTMFSNIHANALRLPQESIRKMFRWKESKQTSSQNSFGAAANGNKLQLFQKLGYTSLISRNFAHQEGHQNPAAAYDEVAQTAPSVQVGSFTLTDDFIRQINAKETYPLGQQDYNQLPPQLQQNFKLNGSEYQSGDPSNPQVGDLRIYFDVVKSGNTVSVIGKQDNAQIEAFYTKNGTINLLSPGNVDPASMFQRAESRNNILTWVSRFVGWLMMFFGLKYDFRADWHIASIVTIFRKYPEFYRAGCRFDRAVRVGNLDYRLRLRWRGWLMGRHCGVCCYA